LAPLVVKPAVEAVFERQGLRVPDIDWWVIHAAGSSVLDNIRDALGIAEEKMELSRETLSLWQYEFNLGQNYRQAVDVTKYKTWGLRRNVIYWPRHEWRIDSTTIRGLLGFFGNLPSDLENCPPVTEEIIDNTIIKTLLS